MMTKIMELHRLLLTQFPEVTGVTRFIDGRVIVTWESPPTKDVEMAAQTIVDSFDWTPKPEPTESDVDSALGRITSTKRQELIEQMLKQYLLDRPGLLETL